MMTNDTNDRLFPALVMASVTGIYASSNGRASRLGLQWPNSGNVAYDQLAAISVVTATILMAVTVNNVVAASMTY